MSTNTRSVFVIFGLGMAVALKLGLSMYMWGQYALLVVPSHPPSSYRGSKQATAEPNSMALFLVGDHVDFHRSGLKWKTMVNKSTAKS